jgi:transcriptional regulator with GAF, ATPase, and Fis domain
MNRNNLNKWILYGLLALVITITFILSSMLLSLITSGKVGISMIIIIILNLIINFSVFFLLYKSNLSLKEKDARINELESFFNKKQEPEEVVVEKTDSKEVNVEELIDAIMPKNIQGMDVKQFTEKILSNIANTLDIVQGLFYLRDNETGIFKPVGKYAYFSNNEPATITEGIAITGQVAKNQKILNLQSIPDNYIEIVSGMGKGSPKSLLIVPLIHKDVTIGIIELASFKPFDENIERLFDKLSTVLAKLISKFK